MEILTRDFGKVNIDEDKIIEFPDGLPGFKEEKEFVLLPLDEDSLFVIMQSVNTPELAFITIEPRNIIKDYEFVISEKTEELLQIEGIEDIILLNIVNIKDKLQDMTINLAAPLVININKNLGKQIILDDSKYPVKFKLENNEAKEMMS
ncbi:MAG TPA: flagellar assembly protein FliW [Halanaerobiales bacterium]|nr:flagellar assembly protein FliW [Halanaerobiales bacterium]